MQNTEQKYLNSFARRKLRSSTEGKLALMGGVLPKYQIKDFSDLKSASAQYQKKILEVGFGYGEHLEHISNIKTDSLVIGSEVYESGVAGLMSLVEGKPRDNLKIFIDDCRILLEQMPDDYLDEVYILFPDPWPKTKHHKRRIISQHSLELLNQKMKPNGYLRIATDHSDYFLWMLKEFSAQSYFYSLRGEFPYSDVELPKEMDKNSKANLLIDEDIKKPFSIVPENHIITKYQQKGNNEGRDSLYLEFTNS